VTAATVQRRADELVRRCYAGLGAAALRAEVLQRLRSIVPVDAAFFATVDPATILFTSAMAEEPLDAATPLFLDNEFGRHDVNKFAELATGNDPVASLDAATGGVRSASARYAEVMAPLRLGDELRAALVAGGRCWGVMCLHREDGAGGFTPAEVDIVRRLSGHIGEGLRRAVVMEPIAERGDEVAGPGVVLLDEGLTVASMNPQAERFLADLAGRSWSGSMALPLAIQATAASLGADDEGLRPPGTTRVRTTTGEWLAIHASRLDGPHGGLTAVVLERAQPVELASLFLEARGLTPAQTRVAELVLQGRSTRQIVNELQISAHTVQEHLRAVFDKFGIGSRRELVASLLGPHQ